MFKLLHGHSEKSAPWEALSSAHYNPRSPTMLRSASYRMNIYGRFY